MLYRARERCGALENKVTSMTRHENQVNFDNLHKNQANRSPHYEQVISGATELCLVFACIAYTVGPSRVPHIVRTYCSTNQRAGEARSNPCGRMHMQNVHWRSRSFFVEFLFRFFAFIRRLIAVFFLYIYTCFNVREARGSMELLLGGRGGGGTSFLRGMVDAS